MTHPYLFRRISSLIIDYIIILSWVALISIVNLVIFHRILDGIPDYLGILGPLGTQLVFFFILTLPVGLYFYGCESSDRHASYGKHKMRLRVSDIDSKTVTRKQIAVRTIVKLLP